MAFSPGDAAENAQVAIRAARVSAKLCPFILGFGKNGAQNRAKGEEERVHRGREAGEERELGAPRRRLSSGGPWPARLPTSSFGARVRGAGERAGGRRAVPGTTAAAEGLPGQLPHGPRL
ncbi:uncharacterized protein LOC144339251 [Macaca mulatta]